MNTPVMPEAVKHKLDGLGRDVLERLVWYLASEMSHDEISIYASAVGPDPDKIIDYALRNYALKKG